MRECVWKRESLKENNSSVCVWGGGDSDTTRLTEVWWKEFFHRLRIHVRKSGHARLASWNVFTESQREINSETENMTGHRKCKRKEQKRVSEACCRISNSNELKNNILHSLHTLKCAFHGRKKNNQKNIESGIQHQATNWKEWTQIAKLKQGNEHELRIVSSCETKCYCGSFTVLGQSNWTDGESVSDAPCWGTGATAGGGGGAVLMVLSQGCCQVSAPPL